MLNFDPGSFRDPEGRVFYFQNRIFRTASPQSVARIQKHHHFLKKLVTDRKLVAFDLVDTPSIGITFEVETIPVVSYPYEWSFDMLKDAALLTLELSELSLEQNLILKDASAFNILFNRNRPIFIDLLSFDDYEEGQAWVAYSQFCRAFLFPLLLRAYRGIEFQTLLRSHLGELPAREIQKYFRTRDLFKPGIFKDVLLQAKLESSDSEALENRTQNSDTASLMSRDQIKSNIRRLRKIISGLDEKSSSHWSRYSEKNSYTSSSAAKKFEVIEKVLAKIRPSQCLDIGSNTGAFSKLALQHSERVIAVDSDSSSINHLYLRSRNEIGPFLFVSDLANPSPSLGWNLKERRSLPERIKSDFVLALALIHHLRISAGIPTQIMIDSLLNLGREFMIEWIDPSDPMVKQMTRDRKNIFQDYNFSEFESAVKTRAEIVGVYGIDSSTRKLCHLIVRS